MQNTGLVTLVSILAVGIGGFMVFGWGGGLILTGCIGLVIAWAWT